MTSCLRHGTLQTWPPFCDLWMSSHHQQRSHCKGDSHTELPFLKASKTIAACRNAVFVQMWNGICVLPFLITEGQLAAICRLYQVFHTHYLPCDNVLVLKTGKQGVVMVMSKLGWGSGIHPVPPCQPAISPPHSEKEEQGFDGQWWRLQDQKSHLFNM